MEGHKGNVEAWVLGIAGWEEQVVACSLTPQFDWLVCQNLSDKIMGKKRLSYQ